MPHAAEIPPDVVEAVTDYIAESVAERVAEQLRLEPDQVKDRVRVTVDPQLDAPEVWAFEVSAMGVRLLAPMPKGLSAFNVDRQSWGTRVLRFADDIAKVVADRVQLAGARRCQQTAEACAAPACSTHARPS